MQKKTNKNMNSWLRNRVGNSDIRATFKVDVIVRWRRKRGRYWRDYVERMKQDRITNIVKERKPLKTSEKRWKDSWPSTSQENYQH